MKQLIWKVVLPLTIISFFFWTKWWYVSVDDAPNILMFGFPLIYLGEGWHTSMSLQIFIIEFFIDFFVYFLFWMLIVFCVNNYLIKIKLPKLITVLLISISVLIVLFSLWIASMPEHIYKLKRDFEIDKIIDSGNSFLYIENKPLD